MSSLTGQQIQNSYQGLIKTENNGNVSGGSDIKLTDGEGNGIGMEVNPTGPLNSLIGFSNIDDTFKRGSIDLQNVNFDVTQFPMAPFNTFSGFAFTDQNDALTGSIIQNRFGGITLGNNVPNQPYIFTDFQGTARVDINNFNNVNNSDNWLTGYNQSIPSASFDGGTRDLTINRNNDTDIVVNIPGGADTNTTYDFASLQNGVDVDLTLTGSDATTDIVKIVAGTNITLTDNGSNELTIDAAGGGGGGQEVRSLQSTRPIGQAGFGNIETTYKLTHMTTGYNTQNYTISSGTEFMVIPFTETEGGVIDKIALQVVTGVAGATTNVHLYKGKVKTVNLAGGGTQEVLDGEFVADLATNVDCSTSGMKYIGGINQTLPAAEDNLYFFLYRMSNALNVVMGAISNNQTINPNNSIFLSGTIPYRFVTWQSGGNTSAPTDLDLQSMSASTGNGLIKTFYTIA